MSNLALCIVCRVLGVMGERFTRKGAALAVLNGSMTPAWVRGRMPYGDVQGAVDPGREAADPVPTRR